MMIELVHKRPCRQLRIKKMIKSIEAVTGQIIRLFF